MAECIHYERYNIYSIFFTVLYIAVISTIVSSPGNTCNKERNTVSFPFVGVGGVCLGLAMVSSYLMRYINSP